MAIEYECEMGIIHSYFWVVVAAVNFPRGVGEGGNANFDRV